MLHRLQIGFSRLESSGGLGEGCASAAVVQGQEQLALINQLALMNIDCLY